MEPARACVAPGTPPHPRSPRWWSECGTEAFTTGLDGVARSPRRPGRAPRPPKRAGRTVGFPRVTARRRTTPSVRFTTGVIRAPETDRKQVTLAQGHHDEEARVDRRAHPPAGDPP